MESLCEVLEFVAHDRPEVRKMAVESIAGLSLDEGVKAYFGSHPEALGPLVACLEDLEQIVALGAWKALINLSKDPKISANLYNHIGAILKVILSEQSPFADFAAMLLSNVSQADCCHLAIVEHLPKLLPVFLKGKVHNPKASYDCLASVFAHVTNCKEGRRFFLSGDGFENLYKILGQAHSSQLLRRGGALSTVRNCLFETEEHERLLRYDDEEDRLFATLLSLLVNPQSAFDEEEMDQMILDLQLEYRHTPAEPDMAIRSFALDSLIILGSTRHGRDVMRAKKIYPVLREWHRQEPEEPLGELLEKAVELLIRDEEY